MSGNQTSKNSSSQTVLLSSIIYEIQKDGVLLNNWVFFYHQLETPHPNFVQLRNGFNSSTISVYELLYDILSYWTNQRGTSSVAQLSDVLLRSNHKYTAEILLTKFGGSTTIKLDLISRLRRQTLESLWFEVARPIKHFVGRVKELQSVRQYFLEEEPILLVHGLGGIGKSELARKFAKLVYEELQGSSVWLHGENEQTLDNSIRRLAKRIDATVDNSSHNWFTEIIEKVQTKYRDTHILIIVDNVDTPNRLLNELIQNCKSLPPVQPRFLITTRNLNVLRRAGQQISLNKFDPLEATELVINSLGKDEAEDDIKDLCETLDYFPLSLQQAITFIRYKREATVQINFSIQSYLELFKSQTATLLEEELNLDHSYTSTTMAAWKVTLDSVGKSEYGPNAMKLLQLMSYTDTNGCEVRDIETLSHLVEAVHTEDANKEQLSQIIYTAEDHTQASNLSPDQHAFSLLRSFDLCQVSNLDDQGPIRSITFLTVHPLVQEVVKLILGSSTEKRLVRYLLLAIIRLEGRYTQYTLINKIWQAAIKYGDVVSAIIPEFFSSSGIPMLPPQLKKSLLYTQNIDLALTDLKEKTELALMLMETDLVQITHIGKFDWREPTSYSKNFFSLYKFLKQHFGSEIAINTCCYQMRPVKIAETILAGQFPFLEFLEYFTDYVTTGYAINQDFQSISLHRMFYVLLCQLQNSPLEEIEVESQASEIFHKLKFIIEPTKADDYYQWLQVLSDFAFKRSFTKLSEDIQIFIPNLECYLSKIVPLRLGDGTISSEFVARIHGPRFELNLYAYCSWQDATGVDFSRFSYDVENQRDNTEYLQDLLSQADVLLNCGKLSLMDTTIVKLKLHSLLLNKPVSAKDIQCDVSKPLAELLEEILRPRIRIDLKQADNLASAEELITSTPVNKGLFQTIELKDILTFDGRTYNWIQKATSKSKRRYDVASLMEEAQRVYFTNLLRKIRKMIANKEFDRSWAIWGYCQLLQRYNPYRMECLDLLEDLIMENSSKLETQIVRSTIARIYCSSEPLFSDDLNKMIEWFFRVFGYGIWYNFKIKTIAQLTEKVESYTELINFSTSILKILCETKNNYSIQNNLVEQIFIHFYLRSVAYNNFELFNIFNPDILREGRDFIKSLIVQQLNVPKTLCLEKFNSKMWYGFLFYLLRFGVTFPEEFLVIDIILKSLQKSRNNYKIFMLGTLAKDSLHFAENKVDSLWFLRRIAVFLKSCNETEASKALISRLFGVSDLLLYAEACWRSIYLEFREEECFLLGHNELASIQQIIDLLNNIDEKVELVKVKYKPKGVQSVM